MYDFSHPPSPQAGNYENVVNGFVYKLSDPEQKPIKVLSGLAGRKIFVNEPGADDNDKKLLVDCDTLEMEQIYFVPENLRPPNSSLVVWKATAAAICKGKTLKEKGKSRSFIHLLFAQTIVARLIEKRHSLRHSKESCAKSERRRELNGRRAISSMMRRMTVTLPFRKR